MGWLGNEGEENEWEGCWKGGKRGQIKHCSISAKQPAFYRSRNKQERMEREMAGKKYQPGGGGGTEDIVKIIRVRHTPQVHGEAFTANLSLTEKFITGHNFFFLIPKTYLGE